MEDKLKYVISLDQVLSNMDFHFHREHLDFFTIVNHLITFLHYFNEFETISKDKKAEMDICCNDLKFECKNDEVILIKVS